MSRVGKWVFCCDSLIHFTVGGKRDHVRGGSIAGTLGQLPAFVEVVYLLQFELVCRYWLLL